MAPRFNDVDTLLYLETIFPLLYVEQKLGWGRLPARYPTWLGIRDVGRRTVEFLLGWMPTPTRWSVSLYRKKSSDLSANGQRHAPRRKNPQQRWWETSGRSRGTDWGLATGHRADALRDAVRKVGADRGVPQWSAGTFDASCKASKFPRPSTRTENPRRTRPTGGSARGTGAFRGGAVRQIRDRDGGSGIAAAAHRQHQRRFEEVQRPAESPQPRFERSARSHHGTLPDAAIRNSPIRCSIPANKATPMTVDQNVELLRRADQAFHGGPQQRCPLHRNRRKGNPRAARRDNEAARTHPRYPGNAGICFQFALHRSDFRAHPRCRTGSVEWRRSSRSSTSTWPSLRNWRANGWMCRSGSRSCPRASCRNGT